MQATRAWLSALLATTAVIAAPSVAFPVNSQVPPVARVAQPFQYQFSSNTFDTSSGSKLTYSVRGAPAWLSLQSSTRTFSGTPQSQDVGPFTFGLSAADTSGATDSQVTLMVQQGPATTLSSNISDVLARSGPLSDTASLNLHPGSQFSVTFAQDTFSGPDHIMYYATLADRSPLPSWITFNADAVTFSGVTPPPVPNPQTIPLRLVASTVAGFADNSLLFNLVVSDHTLTFRSINRSVPVRFDESFSVPPLLDQVLSDGAPIARSDIVSASADGPDWVSFDPATLVLSGNVPREAASANVQIRVSDVYGNSASSYVHLESPLGEAPNPTSTVLPSTQATQTSEGSSAVDPTSGSDKSGRTFHHANRDWVAAAVLGPLALAILLIAVFWMLCRRRRKRRQVTGPKGGLNGSEKQQDMDIERNRHGVTRASEDSLGSHNQLVLDNDPMSLSGVEPAFHRSQRYPVSTRRRSALMTPPKQRASRTSRLSMQSGSGSDSRRLTGLGHGRLQSTGSPSRVDMMARVKARRRCTQCGCSDVETLSSGAHSTTMPRRPMSEMARPSIRMLPREASNKDDRDSQEMIQDLLREMKEMDDRPFQDKRSSYLRKGRTGWGIESEEKTHDEQIYDLHKSYDRLKRELGTGSLRGRPASKPLLLSSSIRSQQAEQTGVGVAPIFPREENALIADTASARSTPMSLRVRPQQATRSIVPADTVPAGGNGQSSNEWTDTDGGSTHRSQQERGHHASRSMLDSIGAGGSQDEWEELDDSDGGEVDGEEADETEAMQSSSDDGVLRYRPSAESRSEEEALAGAQERPQLAKDEDDGAVFL